MLFDLANSQSFYFYSIIYSHKQYLQYFTLAVMTQHYLTQQFQCPHSTNTLPHQLLVCLNPKCSQNNIGCQSCFIQQHQNHYSVPLKIYLQCRTTELATTNSKIQHYLNNETNKKKAEVQQNLENFYQKIQEVLQMRNKIALSIETLLSPPQQNQLKKCLSQSSLSSDQDRRQNQVNKGKKVHTKRQRSREKYKPILISDSQSEINHSSTNNNNGRSKTARKSTSKAPLYFTDQKTEKKENRKQKLKISKKIHENKKQRMEERLEINQGLDRVRQGNSRFDEQIKFNPGSYSPSQIIREFEKSLPRTESSMILCHRVVTSEKSKKYQYLVYFANQFVWKNQKELTPDWDEELTQYWKRIKR